MKKLIALSLITFLYNAYAHAEYNESVCKQKAKEYNKTTPYNSGDVVFKHKDCKDKAAHLYIAVENKDFVGEELNKGTKQIPCKSSVWEYTDDLFVNVENKKTKEVMVIKINKSECIQVTAKN